MPTPRKANTKTRKQPNHDQIAERAYMLWQTRGGLHGHDLDDWLAAEVELNHSSSSPRNRRSARAV